MLYFIVQSLFVKCTSLGFLVDALLVLLLPKIWLEDSGPQRILSGRCLSIEVGGQSMIPDRRFDSLLL